MPRSSSTTRLGEHADNAIIESELLFDEFGAAGLDTPELLSRSLSILVALGEAGRGTSDPRKRRELNEHVAYWRAIRRVMSDGWDETRLLAFDSTVDARLPARDFVELGFEPTGVTDRAVEDFDLDLSQRDAPFKAENCRLVRGRVWGELHRQLSFAKSSLVDIDIARTSVRSLDLSQTRSFGCRFAVNASGTVTIAHAIARAARITVVGRELKADASDFSSAHGPAEDFLVVAAEAMRSEWVRARRRRCVRLVGCRASLASFRGTFLQGVRFERCTFDRASFVDAELQGTAFVDCTLPASCLTSFQRSHAVIERCTFV